MRGQQLSHPNSKGYKCFCRFRSFKTPDSNCVQQPQLKGCPHFVYKKKRHQKNFLREFFLFLRRPLLPIHKFFGLLNFFFSFVFESFLVVSREKNERFLCLWIHRLIWKRGFKLLRRASFFLPGVFFFFFFPCPSGYVRQVWQDSGINFLPPNTHSTV